MPEPTCSAFCFDPRNLHAAANAPPSRLFSEIMGFRLESRLPFPFACRWLNDKNRQAAPHLVDEPASHGNDVQIRVRLLDGLVVELGMPADQARPPETYRSRLARSAFAVKTLPTSHRRGES